MLPNVASKSTITANIRPIRSTLIYLIKYHPHLNVLFKSLNSFTETFLKSKLLGGLFSLFLLVWLLIIILLGIVKIGFYKCTHAPDQPKKS